MSEEPRCIVCDFSEQDYRDIDDYETTLTNVEGDWYCTSCYEDLIAEARSLTENHDDVD